MICNQKSATKAFGVHFVWNIRLGIVQQLQPAYVDIASNQAGWLIVRLALEKQSVASNAERSFKRIFNRYRLYRLFLFEPPPGFEPGTFSLQKNCSTAELRWQLTHYKTKIPKRQFLSNNPQKILLFKQELPYDDNIRSKR